ncbi:hypothetical protein PO124_04055 [Bacillus licheniformis]|nr:hypothetical protein [Bacillus licheniformis]
MDEKALVALFTIATFGLVSPPAALMADKPQEHQSVKESGYTAVYQKQEEPELDEDGESKSSFDTYRDELLNEAEDLSFVNSAAGYRRSLKTSTGKKCFQRSRRSSSAIS